MTASSIGQERPAAEAAPSSARQRPRSGWAQRPERSNALALRFMAWVSLRLGRTPARGLLYLIALYFLLFSPSARAAITDWLRHVRAERPDWRPRWRALFRQFLTFASVVHDRVFLVSDRCGMFDITMHHREVAHDYLDNGRGLMLMGAHMGSFEVLHSLASQLPGLRVAMAMYQENAQKINHLLAAINPKAALDVVPLGQVDSMIRLHSLLDANTIIGMMGDRALGGDATRAVPFFGQPAEFPLGPFRLAAILRRPLIFMVGLYRGGKRYEIYFDQLADFSNVPAGGRQAMMELAMQRYAALLEKYGRMAPDNWFNFYDFWQVAPAAQKPAGAKS
jgi:predicted LPLAT superfamily acyltransferase